MYIQRPQLGELLRRLRESKGLTQEQTIGVVDSAYSDPRSLRRLENGQTRAARSRLITLVVHDIGEHDPEVVDQVLKTAGYQPLSDGERLQHLGRQLSPRLLYADLILEVLAVEPGEMDLTVCFDVRLVGSIPGMVALRKGAFTQCVVPGALYTVRWQLNDELEHGADTRMLMNGSAPDLVYSWKTFSVDLRPLYKHEDEVFTIRCLAYDLQEMGQVGFIGELDVKPRADGLIDCQWWHTGALVLNPDAKLPYTRTLKWRRITPKSQKKDEVTAIWVCA